MPTGFMDEVTSRGTKPRPKIDVPTLLGSFFLLLFWLFGVGYFTV